MCDIWKANSEKRELSTEEIQKHIKAFEQLGVKRVALSGGEALMHSNLWTLCDALKSIGIKISLLSTGVTLKHHAADVVNHCDDVIVSLDGTPPIHNQIRNIPGAFEKLAEGVKALRDLNPSFKVTGRCVIQKSNYREFEGILKTAYELGLNQISFLPADVSSTAFNRTNHWEEEKIHQVALEWSEAVELDGIIKNSFTKFEDLYISRFIAESPEKMRQIAQHYKAILGKEPFPKKKCNAPWVSAVIESNGDVMPCFFHPTYGNIYKDGDFNSIINSAKAIQFRKNLDMVSNPTCQKCVCALHIGPMQSV
jgi:MoaA/NifB/PqqE/SkfB family radical SAM enzyme